MPRIFISYRRDDSGKMIGRLYDGLVNEFGRESVFRDIYSIEAGRDFAQVINDSLKSCEVCLAVIGEHWLDKSAAGLPRIHDPADFVRMEIETALKLKLRVVPVLIDPAVLPAESALPESLRPLLQRQKANLSDERWGDDFPRLVDSLGGVGEPRGSLGARARAARALIIVNVLALAGLAVQWTLPLSTWGSIAAWIADHVVSLLLVMAALVAVALFVARGGRERPTQAALRALRRLAVWCERASVQSVLFGLTAALLLAIWATPRGVTIRERQGPVDNGFCNRFFVDSRMRKGQTQQCPGDRNVGCGAVAFSCSYYEVRIFTGLFRAAQLQASVAIGGVQSEAAGGGEASVSWSDAAVEQGSTFEWSPDGRELNVRSAPGSVPRTIVILATRQYDPDLKPAKVDVRVAVTSGSSAAPFRASCPFSVDPD